MEIISPEKYAFMRAKTEVFDSPKLEQFLKMIQECKERPEQLSKVHLNFRALVGGDPSEEDLDQILSAAILVINDVLTIRRNKGES